MAGSLSVAGLGGGPDALAAVMPVVVTTFGGAAMLMAFVLFGKRRRDDEPTDSDENLAAAAASSAGAVASSALVEAAPGPASAPGPTAADAELAMPRWRRPSLLEARKADPTRAAAVDTRLTFDHGAALPVGGHERRRIRYRVVRLLDRPDELLALDIGALDAGDEVELLERSGVYWFVLCPDGQQGWVHKMVLGEVVEGPAVPGPAERATGPRRGDEVGAGSTSAGSDPLARDPMSPALAWALPAAPAGDVSMDIDDDVLLAFRAAQGRG